VIELPEFPGTSVILSRVFLCDIFGGFDGLAKVRSHGPPVRISVGLASIEQDVKCGEGPQSNMSFRSTAICAEL
jgi:hypothetical protein